MAMGRHRHRLFLVVRDHDAVGYADLFERIDQFELGLLAQFLVQRAERFVIAGFSDVLPLRQSDTLMWPPDTDAICA